MNHLSLVFLLLVTSASFASDQSPYAGEERRSIKSLSEQEVNSLQTGMGMGFAKLAELNDYPGPKHVLELAAELDLTPSQLAETEALFAEMQANAVALGKQFLEAESALDRDFETGTINAESLEKALAEIGNIKARLRYVHLEAHLRQKRLLTATQIATYDRIRGYGAKADDLSKHDGHH